MIHVSQAQMEAHAEQARAAFEQEMLDHLLEFSPPHCAVIQAAGVREVVRLGMDRAAGFGFTNRGPVRLFLELMFMFGSEFATDPQHAWAAPSLEESMPGDQMFRAEQLHAAAGKYLDTVSGPDHRHAVAALRRTQAEMRQFRWQDLASGNFEPTMVAVLHRIYPEKTEYLKLPGLQGVLRIGLGVAAGHRVTQLRGGALFVFLAFVLGRGFADDPLYPWIRSALADERLRDGDARAARVESRAAAYLDHVVKYLRTQ